MDPSPSRFADIQAHDLPRGVAAVDPAVRQHRDEVWRKANPPYLLYGAIGGALLLILLSVFYLLARTITRASAVPARK